MALLIDTSVLIDLERRKGLEDVDLDLLTGDVVALSSITASEFLVGAYRSSTIGLQRAREAYIEALFQRYAVLPFDLQVARVHARLAATLESTGQRIGAHDLIIAATALAYNYDVTTHNLREFRRVPGLTVRSIDW